MKKNEMTWQAMLTEAVSLVSAVIYLGLQIYYGISYGVSAINIIMNVVVMLLVYAGLTMLGIYPERVNGLTKEACSGDVRKYTIRMVRIAKLIFVSGLLFTSICDVMGKELPAGYTVGVIFLMVAVALYYEYRIIRILRERYKK
ncbi:MAG: transglycosylase [Clostridiales bacterium]|nr:transglycosylase [Roseburia sp.]MDD7637583.1 transglycosylase [Clostridiales bacterium]MDY4112202.1 transglycosylase [Roseburia sp.]